MKLTKSISIIVFAFLSGFVGFSAKAEVIAIYNLSSSNYQSCLTATTTQSFVTTATTTNISAIRLMFTGSPYIGTTTISITNGSSSTATRYIKFPYYNTTQAFYGSSTSPSSYIQFPSEISVATNTKYWLWIEKAGYNCTLGTNSGVYGAGTLYGLGTDFAPVDLAFNIYTENLITYCTSFAYNAWETCLASSTQVRTVSSSSPVGCTIGTSTLPILSQACVYTAGLTVIDIDSMSTPIFALLISFISQLFVSLWPFILVVAIGSAFAYSLTKFVKRIITKNE